MLFKSLQSISIKSNNQRTQLSSSFGLVTQSSNNVALLAADVNAHVDLSPLLTADVNASSFESFGSSTNGCSLLFGVVFKDNYKIKSFGSNIHLNYDSTPPSVVLEEGDQHLYQLTIDTPYGINQLSFNVTNVNNETTLLIIDKPFNCIKLNVPIEVKYISNFTLGTYLGFYLNLGFNQFNGVDLSSSITCKLSFTAQCSITYKGILGVDEYQIYGFSFNESKKDELFKSKIQLSIYDLYDNEQIIMLDNTVIDYSAPKTEIESYTLNYPNNSVINPNTQSNVVSLKVTYKSSSSLSSPINSFPVIDSDGNSGPYFKDGSYILGTENKKVYYFSFYISTYFSSKFDYKEFPSNNKMHLSYSSPLSLSTLFLELYPSKTLILDESLNKFIYEVNVSVPTIIKEFLCSPVRVYYDTNTSYIQHPYGVSRSISNSSYFYSTESLMFFSKIKSSQGISYLGYSDYPSIQIPDYPGIVSNDTEKPMIHSIKNTLLENNRILTTLNISDAGSGLYQLLGIQPLFTTFAKESLVSGDTNNGIYQILSNTEDISLINSPYLFYYDEFGAQGLSAYSFYYKDLDFNPPEPILKVISASDITFFEFDRHEIDTSFDDLELNLKINFNGANETSVVPKISLTYSSFKKVDDNQVFRGVFNKTTQMYHIKIKVQARESGAFRYSLSIPPFSITNTQLASIFPEQIVKLTTNYLDHHPPIVSGLYSLTDTQLFVEKGESIQIGWNIQIYDYPVGLDYAYIEVTSNLDFEPFKFNFIPDTSVPGNDILSNYTILIPVKPVENQTYYISAMKLYDKNGFYSSYPPVSFIQNFDPFIENNFASQQKIKVNVTQDVAKDYEYDNQAPDLLTFSFPSSFDSFGINRTAICEFSIKDIGRSGISIRHRPYIYIQSLYSRIFRVQSELIQIDNETSIHYYRAVINFEYGFLAYGALISIHGITDNSLNIVSFTSQRLKEKGFTSTISNPIQAKPPVILDISSVNEDGGKLFIYGKQFNSPTVYMDIGSGFKPISTSFTSALAITAIVPNVKGYKSIQFKVISNSLSSNIVQVDPIVNPITDVSNCSIYNNCSGNGQCINSKCVCIEGSEGPDCSSLVKSIETKPENNTPSFGSFNSMIEMYILEEINLLGTVVKSYSLDSWYGSTIQSQYHSAEAYKYTQQLEGTDTNITIVVDIFDAPLSINFATNKLQMNKGTIKYTISFDSYPFGSRFNTLLLKVNASISIQDSKCKLNSIGLSKNSNNIEWIKLRSENQSIYGKFIQNAVIDYRLQNIDNKLLVSPTNENQLAVIGIQIPYFFEQAVLDPDFSVLFDLDNLAKNKESSCYVEEVDPNGNIGETNKRSGGLSNSKIIIISVVCGLAALSFIIATVILIKKKKEFFRFKKRLDVSSN